MSWMRISLPMLVSFFVCALVIRLMGRIFGDKPDELFTLTFSLLIAIATGFESTVSVIKKHIGLD
jgi:hypothetical protein